MGMGVEPRQDWEGTLASTLAWWDEAGVDLLVEEDPRDWLARPAPRGEATQPAPAQAQPAPAALPDTLEAFVAWRQSDAAPEGSWMGPRVAPTGPADAEWVILVDMPEADAPEQLLGGTAGALFDRMLAAIGLDRSAVHLVPFAWGRPIGGRILPEEGARLVALARHHLGLLRPAKLLLLGQAAGRVLDETSGPMPDGNLHLVNHFGRTSAVLTSYPPRLLLERPLLKSEAWKHLLSLNRGSTA